MTIRTADELRAALAQIGGFCLVFAGPEHAPASEDMLAYTHLFADCAAYVLAQEHVREAGSSAKVISFNAAKSKRKFCGGDHVLHR
jgi:hypothetical protein